MKQPSPGRSADRLLPLVYQELRRLARHYLRGEGSYQTLQPTALVHEAYLRLIRIDRMAFNDKTHFLAMAATQMRRILVERSRAAAAEKRGSRPRRITLSEGTALTLDQPVEMLALDEALEHLASRSERQARIAEMRVFSGMLVEEVAEALGISVRTVKREWQVARAWLGHRLGQKTAG